MRELNCCHRKSGHGMSMAESASSGSASGSHVRRNFRSAGATDDQSAGGVIASEKSGFILDM
ncbi:MAG: hypothetical protein ACK58T_09585, partial [Phycisphaerae bacterium]